MALAWLPAQAQDDMRDQQPMTTDRNATQHTDGRGVAADEGDLDRDLSAKDFVHDAAELNHAEIEAARTALKHSSSDAIREYAQQMINDHTDINHQLRSLAASAGLDLPDEATLMDRARGMVLKMRDDSFDRAYLDNQIEAHKKTIRLYQSAEAYLDNPPLQELAREALPQLTSHLEKAMELRDRFEDNGDGERRPARDHDRSDAGNS